MRKNALYLPLVLAMLLYLLIYFLRWQQGGWEPNIDLFGSLRVGLDQRISTLLPSPQAQLLSGILLGNKKDLPGRLKLALRDTSTLHIVVVSGQNLTLVAGLFLNLAGFLKKRVAIIISLVAIIGYTLLTGFQVPVVRAAIMAIFAFSAQFFGRQRSGIWILIVTASFMLLINPSWITDLSFQLSFLATFGVIVIAPIIEKYLKALPQFLKVDLAVTTGAQLMVIPVIAQNFHQFSIVGILTNLLVGWTVPFIMMLGMLMLMVSFVWGGLSFVVGLLTSALLTYFIYIVEFFASLPFAWEYVGEKSWIVWLGYYLLLLGLIIFMLSLDNDKKDNN